MRPKKHFETPDMFRSRLDQILNSKHPLFNLANQINWTFFEEEFGSTYDEHVGRPGKPIRLMVGLQYLKYTFNESDESILFGFLENPYWQYFCGYEYFQHEFPTDPSNMTRFRDRIGKKGVEKMLEAMIHTAKRMKVLKPSHMNRINIDTTVQEKAISFPTDARLYYKMRATLVRHAKKQGISLRQSYVRLAKVALAKQARYSHAKQYKRARRETRKLKTWLGCVYRDIYRKVPNPEGELSHSLDIATRILIQKKDSKNKIYSVHAPETECISKGKAHKRYEFGVKVGMATTSKDNWIVGIQAFPGNPYDGHTLNDTIKQVERLIQWKVKDAYVDLGYRGHDYHGEAHVNIVNFRHMKRLTRSAKAWMKRRAAIEPIFGHLKSDNRMSKNYLKDREGDQINALLCGCGFNMRKLLAVFLLPYFVYRKIVQFIKNMNHIDLNYSSCLL